jgi:hypothetical protein
MQALARTSQMRIKLAFGKSFIESNAIPAHEKGIKKCNELSEQIDKFIDK